MKGDEGLRGSHDKADTEWIGGGYGVIMIRPWAGQPPAGLLAALGLAAHRAYFVCFSYY
jgi:hypothetical protein